MEKVSFSGDLIILPYNKGILGIFIAISSVVLLIAIISPVVREMNH